MWRYKAVAVGAWVGKGPIHQMKNTCAGETALGHVRIDGQGFDPRTLLHLKLTTVTHKSSIEEITERMTKLAHVPVQTWRGWDPDGLFGGWFSATGGFKTLLGAVGQILGAYTILPCFLSSLGYTIY
jgi:hypothetical protein